MRDEADDAQKAIPENKQADKPSVPEIAEKESRSAPQPEADVPGKPAPKTDKQADTPEDIIEILTFQLGVEEFAFRVSDIEEILNLQQITPVPRMPDYILGITSLRGKVMPVIDLKKRLLIADDGAAYTRKKILTLKGDVGHLGAVIDKINGVIRVASPEIGEPPAHLAEAEMAFIEGVVLHDNRFISVIRVGKVLDMNLK